MPFLPQSQQVSNVFPLGLSISKTAAGLSALFPSTALQFHCFGSPRHQSFSKLSEKLRQCHIYAYATKPQKLTSIDALCEAGEVSWRQFPLNSRRNHFPHPPNRQVRAFQMFEDVASSCCKKRWLRCTGTLTAVWRWPMREFLISEGHPAHINLTSVSSSSRTADTLMMISDQRSGKSPKRREVRIAHFHTEKD